MKISWIKQENDNRNFNMVERLGMDVYKLENPEEIDEKIETLIKKDYKTIVLSSDIAGFSSDIVTKYQNNSSIKIIISSRK